MFIQQFLYYLSFDLSQIRLIGSTWQGSDLIFISRTKVNGQSQEDTFLANMLYTIISVIVQRL